MKKNYVKNITVCAFFVLGLFLTSCKPKINISAVGSDSVSISFTTGFAEETAKALRSMSGLAEDAPLFSEGDVLNIIEAVGAVDIKSSIPSPTEISSSGTIHGISESPLTLCGLITKTPSSLSLTLGPEQFSSFYEMLSDDFKTYFDLMMIPALIGETMTVSEYEELLKSMYGPTFAKDVVNGELQIVLSSPDGKKSVKESVSLGDVLTLTKSKKWTIAY